mmetsp:Transcript_92160/g.256778  ORF Transcript_92160/g.256778 Transcript_92160/m.256778 type:complete len:231 (-) Transcript_92160:744-1436(-)
MEAPPLAVAQTARSSLQMMAFESRSSEPRPPLKTTPTVLIGSFSVLVNLFRTLRLPLIQAAAMPSSLRFPLASRDTLNLGLGEKSTPTTKSPPTLPMASAPNTFWRAGKPAAALVLRAAPALKVTPVILNLSISGSLPLESATIMPNTSSTSGTASFTEPEAFRVVLTSVPAASTTWPRATSASPNMEIVTPALTTILKPADVLVTSNERLPANETPTCTSARPGMSRSG